MKLLHSVVGIVAILFALNAYAGGRGKNTPPTVSLTSPANGALFSSPATINLTATASDADGTVTQVQFFQGTTLLGTSTASPYSFSWTNVATGSYSLTAKATDNGGVVTTSTAVSITVTAPVAPIIASPANGAAIYGNAVMVSGTYTGDPNTTTVLADNGNSSVVATLNGNNYTVSLPLFRGSNTLTVHVDRIDKTFDTATVTVTGNDPPAIALTLPSGNSFTAPTSISLAASALSPGGSINRVVFTENGTTLATVTSAPYQFTWNSVGAGTYTLGATATDNNGYSTTASKSVTVTAPDQPPVVSITGPASGSYYFAPASIPLQANASDPDGTVTYVQFFSNGSLLGTSYVAPYSFNWANVPAGNYTLTAQATDNSSSQTTSSAVSVTVYPADIPPTVSLTAPANGQTFTAPANVTLSANASDSDGTVAKVDFYQGSTLLGTATTAPYTFAWQNVASGAYSLKAVATDNVGAYTPSAVINITVDAPPTVSLTSPASGQSFTAPASITVSANAADSDGTVAKVVFYQGTTLIGTATSAPYSINWQSVPAGSYTVTAVATDNGGLATTSAPVGISVTNPDVPPTVSLITPSSGAVLWTPGNITLTAKAADSDGTVSKVDFYQGSTLIGTATSAPYSVAWASPAAGTYSLTAVATDNAGMTTTSSAASVTVKTLQIVISTPQANASLSGLQAVVTGSFQGPANSGVTVNGAVAAIDTNNNFYANVTLVAGSNTLTAAINTPTGQTVSQNITVTSDGKQPLLQMSVDATEGISPLTVNFTFVNNRTQAVTLQVNGGTPATVAAGATYVLSPTISGAGAVQFQFVESDAAGNTSNQAFVIVAYDPVQMDQTFTALWNGMNNALIARDKNSAMVALSGPAQNKFGPVFDVLMPNYAAIASSFSPLQRQTLSAEVGEYAVNRTIDGTNRIFFLYFVRDQVGVWRLDSM